MMSDLRYESPLRLPSGWVRTPLGQRSYDNSFSRNLTFAEALDYLEEEIRQIAPNDSVRIYSSYEQLRSERSRKALSKETGICVQIHHSLGGAMMACDKWALTEHNIYALSLGLRALRQMESWGIAKTQMLYQFFSSHAEGDAPSRATQAMTHDGSLADWMLALGLGPTATLEDANAIYRRRAKDIAHDEHKLIELNLAMDSARKYLR